MPAQERLNRNCYLNSDERQVPITITFYDDDGALVDLSDPDWTATIVVWDGAAGGETIIDETMTITPDQVNYKGEAIYITQEADHGNAPGEYRCIGRAVHTDGREFEVPKLESRNYFRFFIRATN